MRAELRHLPLIISQILAIGTSITYTIASLIAIMQYLGENHFIFPGKNYDCIFFSFKR